MKKLVVLFFVVLMSSVSWAYFLDPMCCEPESGAWTDTDWTPPGKCCQIPAAPDLYPDILIGATLYMYNYTKQDVGIENTSISSTAEVYFASTVNFYSTGPGFTDHFMANTDYFPGPTPAVKETLAVYDGTTDYLGASGETWTGFENSTTWNQSYSGGDLAYFATAQTICWWTDSGFAVIGSGSSNIVAVIDTQAKTKACIVYEYEEGVPVTLSSFTANYFDGMPILQWTTQSETNNIGWNVYRAENDEYEYSMQINNNLILGAGTTSEPTDYIFEDGYTVYPTMSYWYWIEDISADGNTNIHGPITLTVPEEGYNPESPEIYNEARLFNLPNPFNPNTTIMFDIEGNVSGEILIYDIKGNLVKKLHDGPIPQSGVNWDSTNELGNKVPSGIYLYVLKTAEKTYAKKMVLAK
jgi:hypothetical protein